MKILLDMNIPLKYAALLADEMEKGAILSIDLNKSRLRLLPLE